jgi:multidrug resistance protein
LVGPLSDRLGRRPILICGMLLFVLATLACALTTDFNLFLAGRFVQGATVCFILVAGYASIHEMYEQKEAIKIISLMNSVTVVAPALGPLIGGLIVTFATWRWTFWPLEVCSFEPVDA